MTAGFLQTLFAPYGADAQLQVELRLLRPESERRAGAYAAPSKWFSLSEPCYLDNAQAYAESMAPEWDVYYGVLPRSGKTKNDTDCCIAHWLFCDVDGGEDGWQGASKLLRSCGIRPPHMIVRSGGGLHCYWRLCDPWIMDTPESREMYRSALRRLCRRIGGVVPGAHADYAATNPARILRIPGTFNHKKTPIRTVDLIRCQIEHTDWTGEPHSLKWWRANLPAAPEDGIIAALGGPRVRRATDYNPGGISPGLRDWAMRGYTEGERHTRLVSDAAFLFRDCGLPESDVQQLIYTKASQSTGASPVTADELDGIIKWGARRAGLSA